MSKPKGDDPEKDDVPPVPGDEDGLPPPGGEADDDGDGYIRTKPKRVTDLALSRSISEALFGLVDMGHDRLAQVTGFSAAKTGDANLGFEINDKEAAYFRRLCDEMAKYLGAEVLPLILCVAGVIVIEAGKFMAWRKWASERRPAGASASELPAPE